MRKLLPLFLALLVVSSAQAQTTTVLDRVQSLPPRQMDEVLWLARAVLSESDRTEEQRLVAWVIRNRVETNFRGDTYRDVVLEPRQFSAFNSATPRRDYILGLDQSDKVPSWMNALAVSINVYQSRARDRPFGIDTRHYYSPVSMVGPSEPTWAASGRPLSSPAMGIDPNRFRFFAGIDQGIELNNSSPESDDFPAIADSETPAETAEEPNTAQKIDEQRIEQEKRASERTKTFRRSTRVRRFSGRVGRPSRPRLRSGGR
jgi:Cell Wall Hydrolase